MKSPNKVLILISIIISSVSFYFELSMIDTFLIFISLIILAATFAIKYRWQIYEWGVKEYHKKVTADPINNYSDLFKSLQQLKSTCTRLDDYFKKY